MSGHAPSKLLASAGFVTWGVTGAPTVVRFFERGGDASARSIAWWLAFVAFGAAFWVSAAGASFGARARAAGLLTQTLAALVVIQYGRGGFESALLAVIAGEAPLVVNAKVAVAWVLGQTAALACIFFMRTNVESAVVGLGSYFGFQVFAAGAGLLADRESKARAELLRVHAELLATRELFADATRTAERLRISRDLHDTLGHNLTALALNIEVARNTADGRAVEPVMRAHALTKELLAELRAVVSAMREDAPLGLKGALRTLAAGIPYPKVHLTLPETLAVDAALAHTIFRCVQEALTNAIRHAGAKNVFVTIADANGQIVVSARDDGRGAQSVRAGNGLSGLKERLEEIGGRLEIVSAPGEGMTTRAFLPQRSGAA